jgi:hypothetical protein
MPVESAPTSSLGRPFHSAVTQLRLFGIVAVALYGGETAISYYAARMIGRLNVALAAHDQAATLALTTQMQGLEQFEPLEFLLVLAAVAAFFVAMYGPRKAMTLLGRRDWKFSYGWTVATMIVPLWNFYRPWVGLGEIDRAVNNAARTGRIDDGWRRDFSIATLGLGIVFMAGGLLVQLIDFITDSLPMLAMKKGGLDLSLLADVSIITVIAFAAITLAVALYLLRQARNLGRLARAFA